jgi:hypothetical protein
LLGFPEGDFDDITAAGFGGFVEQFMWWRVFLSGIAYTDSASIPAWAWS